MKDSSPSRRRIHILMISLGILAAIVIFYVLAFYGFGIPCLFHKATGLLCPGCGNSRAAMSLLRLDIIGALKYNLLFPLEFFYIAWVYFCCCKQYLKGKSFSYQPPCIAFDVTVLIAVVFWWIVRNLI